MDKELLSSSESARKLGISVLSLYDWLARSRRGEFELRGRPFTILYLQGGAKGQGRIHIESSEIERIREAMRVKTVLKRDRRPPVVRQHYPASLCRWGDRQNRSASAAYANGLPQRLLVMLSPLAPIVSKRDGWCVAQKLSQDFDRTADSLIPVASKGTVRESVASTLGRVVLPDWVLVPPQVPFDLQESSDPRQLLPGPCLRVTEDDCAIGWRLFQ